MRHIIARLLRDFESGLMNRRQLIESLALAATAASAFAQTPEAAAPAAPARQPALRTAELDHISFQVKDYRVTRDFYADLMGMEVKNDNGKSECELYFGNSSLLARNHFRPRGAEGAQTTTSSAATPAPAANGRPASTATVDHIAYRVFNWDTEQVKAELMRRKLLTDNARLDTGGGPNYASYHVSDPDGFNLQISGWAGPGDSINKKKAG